jgi:Putative beta-barrel porin-2, OmpL-like. bbp2
MIRRNLARVLSGLAVAGSLGLAAQADDNAVLRNVRIYRTGNSQDQSPEQSVPQSTENKNGTAAKTNGGEAAAEEPKEKEEESVGWLQQQLNCSALGSCLQCSNVKIAGWLDQGFTWNPDSPDNRFNFPMTFNDRSNEYQMNQFYLYAEKAVKTEGCCWDCGWRIDVLYGTDYYFTTSTGWELEDDGTQKWNSEDGPRFQFGPARLYGVAVPQLYAEIYAPCGKGIDIKIGHFYTPMGYETVTSPTNFFYSHAYTHQYFEPFTHWGVIANTPVTDSLKIGLGAVMGWDTLNDAHNKVSVLGTATWTSCDKNTTVFYGILVGDEPGLLGNEGTRIYQSLYVTHKMCEKFTSVTGTDLVWQNNGSFNNAGNKDDAEAYSLYQYLLYDITKCCSVGIRAEVSRDDDNLRVIPVGSLSEGGTYSEITLGLNYKPYENLRIRPEVRWDWADFSSGVFDDFSDNNQFTASVDVVLTF